MLFLPFQVFFFLTSDLPIFKEQLEPATDGVSYMYFQLACDVVIQSYNFSSVHELHEFLWHGKDTGWKFVEK